MPDLTGVNIYKAEDLPGELCMVCEHDLEVMSPDFDIFTTPAERHDQLTEAFRLAIRRNRVVLCARHRAKLQQAIDSQNAAS